ncbi:GRAM domain-containing protein 2B-like isoform X1 [Osmerus mordax]|uniref:GRAM domain-containing protein 2B-like isoform X1 n=1 Tax=Osmerus mordax TaxID=8014 RepID=UPI00350E8F57
MVLTTEQPERTRTPLSTPEQFTKSLKPVARKDSSRGILSTSETENGGEDRPRRSGKHAGEPQPSLDLEWELDGRKKTPIMRFKAAEQPSPIQNPNDSETKIARKKSSQISKTNLHYHKIFKHISKDETLKQSYTCALQKDILYQGKLYVSDNWICFHSKVFGRDTKITIPVVTVTYIKKTKTAILVPNALVITTTNERHVFVSFLSRDTTFKLLTSLCIHLDGDNTGSSPIPSSAENSFRLDCPTSLPLDFSVDFLDLDGGVRHRRQDVPESSSSGSQTPDYDKMSEFPSLPDTFLSGGKNGEVAVHADVHLQTPSQKHTAAHHNVPSKLPQGVVHKEQSPQSMSLHTLLLIYLFLVSVLVLTSCYMAFKIVGLEQRLTSLGEYGRNGYVANPKAQVDFNAAMYGELSTNLFRLEKIQRNLQKLLEET